MHITFEKSSWVAMSEHSPASITPPNYTVTGSAFPGYTSSSTKVLSENPCCSAFRVSTAVADNTICVGTASDHGMVVITFTADPEAVRAVR